MEIVHLNPHFSHLVLTAFFLDADSSLVFEDTK